MANPGYPMQPPPPMGGMPMGPGMPGPGPGPMPGPGMMRPMRRGTSRVVPVVVSAGLAIGVFCGLLFGLGTGSDEAKAQTTETKKDQGSSAETPGVLQAKPSTEVPKPMIDGSAGGSADAGSATAAVGSAGSADAGSAAGSAAPAPKAVKLIIAIKPEAAAQVAKITVDGKDVEPTSEFELGDAPKKKVAIYIKANGFKDYTYEGEIEAGKDTKFEFEMQKKVVRPAGGTLPRPETGGGKKPGGGGKKPGGGLIDI